MPSDADIGRVVRLEMWEQQVTQTEVAELIGGRQEQVSRSLRGQRAFKVQELAMIAWLFDMTIDDLIGKASR